MAVAGLLQRFDGYQRRHRWVGLPLAVVYKFVDDQGTYQAALLSYYGFVSLFPLLLLAVTILGFVLANDPAAQQAVLASALRNFPVIGDQIGANVHSLHGSIAALWIGIVVSLYGSLGVTQALLNAMCQMWAVPIAERPGLPAAYGRGVLLLGLLGLGVLATTALSALGTVTSGALATGPLAGLGPVVPVVSLLLAIAVNVGVFLVGLKLITVASVGLRDLLPGAVAAAIAWQVLQLVGTYLVGHELAGMSASYGLFGIVLGLLAWIYVAVLIILICAELNTVRVLELSPRSLFSVMPDDSDMTAGDHRALTAYARAPRQKSFQDIDVTFEPPPSAGDEAPGTARPGRSADGDAARDS
jgi:YihY family inner membrane protein